MPWRGAFGRIDFLRALVLERLLQLLPALFDVEVFGIDELDTDGLRELFGAVVDQHHVFGFFHDRAGQQDGILHAMHVRDRAGLARRAVHDRRIEFVLAIVVEHRAFARVEQRRILHDDDRFRHGIDAARAGLERVVAGVQRALELGAHGLLALGRDFAADYAGATVDDENWGGGMGHGNDSGEQDWKEHDWSVQDWSVQKRFHRVPSN